MASVLLFSVFGLGVSFAYADQSVSDLGGLKGSLDFDISDTDDGSAVYECPAPAEPLLPPAAEPGLAPEGWVEEGGERYYYEGGGRLSGELLDGGSWYYLDPERGGAMASSEFVLLEDPGVQGGLKWVYYGPDGRMLYGERLIDGGWYYLAPGSGAVSYGFVLLEDPGVQGGLKWVWYGESMGDGRMRYGEHLIDGGWYYLAPGSGAVSYGFVLLDDPSAEGGRKWVWYGPHMGDGRMRYGEQFVDGGWYYLTPGNGAVDYEWALIPDGLGGSKWVYYGPYMGDGRMRYGKQLIDGEKYRFNMTTGEVVSYFKVYLDAGHGWNSSGNGVWDSGSIGSGYQEANLTSELVDLVAAVCREQYGLDVYVNKSGAYYNRQQEARDIGCSTFVSIHFNAGGGSGTESYIHSSNPHAGSAVLQDIIHPHLVSGTGLTDRGQRANALAVCSWRMPSVLLEVGFIDNWNDMSAYQKNKQRIASSVARGIYEASLNDACIQ